jgi:hypothetical protein
LTITEVRNSIAVRAFRNDHAGVIPQPDATLDSLAELFALLEQAGLQFWLAGGWAVDFHAGRVTRPHSDVDLVVDHADKEELHALLLDAEFKVVEDSEPDAEMTYQRDNFKVDLSFVVELDDGTVVSPGWEHWPWPPGSLSSGISQLSGVSCHVVSASTLLTSKRDYEAHVGDEPRPCDLADIQVLERLVIGRGV